MCIVPAVDRLQDELTAVDVSALRMYFISIQFAPLIFSFSLFISQSMSGPDSLQREEL